VLKPKSLGQPGLDSCGAVFCFPFLQRFVIAAFGLYDFAGVRFFVDLHLARLASLDCGWAAGLPNMVLIALQGSVLLRADPTVHQECNKLANT